MGANKAASTMHATASSKRIRPAKHRAITEAAAAAFLAEGYEGASLDHIAATAGVSKQTIYNHFADKESLFRAICGDLTSRLVASLHPPGGSDENPAVTLRRLGQACLELALLPSSLALHRLIIGEAARFPELGRAIYQAGPARIVAELAAYLEEQTERGRLSVDDPSAAAEQFLGMLIGHHQLRALLGLGGPDASIIARRVEEAVGTFLRAFGLRPAALPRHPVKRGSPSRPPRPQARA
jgi:TetR/AcrR family transcriptional regulator, mexJK operon transcriptional repressor